MGIDSSDFIAQGSGPEAQWSQETAWFLLTRQQVGGRLLLRKSLKPQFLSDSRLRETLRKEYEIGTIVGMDTDYVVNYYQMVDTPDECYLTMDFVEGVTLAELLLTDPDVLGNRNKMQRAFIQLLEGLRSFHRNQVVHLDIKPSNIMLTHVSHDIRIIDLGFCYADAYHSSMGMTEAFCAPEQMDGSGDVDARTDIYAIGKLLQWAEGELGDRCQWRKSRVYKKLVNRCLCKNKNDRWQNVDEIIDFMMKSQKKSKIIRFVSMSIFCIVFLLSLIYYLYQMPITGNDNHVLYGNFSIFDGTCAVVGKITDDENDYRWQGNLYVFSEVKHWGRTYQVTGIADNAYLNDTTFATISLPYSLTYIGASAFRECTNLIAINIPDGVEHIGSAAFWGDESLSKVHLPASIHTVSEACFHKCKFTRIIVPEGVTKIELDAFAVCPYLREISLPQSLKSLGRGVFWRCDSLQEIILPASLTTIGEYTFLDCTSLKKVENHAIDPQPAMSLFNDSVKNVRLLVPPTSIGKYEQAQEWNKLTIEPLPIQ